MTIQLTGDVWGADRTPYVRARARRNTGNDVWAWGRQERKPAAPPMAQPRPPLPGATDSPRRAGRERLGRAPAARLPGGLCGK